MKNLIKIVCVFGVAFGLSACGPEYIVKKEIVTVNKPVPYCPPPPDVPEYAFQVDLLTQADLKDPGTVGQAYKLDMTALRKNDRTMRAIIEQYRNTSNSFSTVQQQIDEIFSHLNEVENTRVESLIHP
jgi:hypothetical protein